MGKDDYDVEVFFLSDILDTTNTITILFGTSIDIFTASFLLLAFFTVQT